MRTTVRAIVIKDNGLLVMDRNKFGDMYFSLIGGGIEPGEERLTALNREVMEEASIVIANPRLVIEEDAGEVYGKQFIYICDYVSGEPALSSDSIEAKLTSDGKNLYKPMWLPLSEIATANLLPRELKNILVKFINEGFPDHAVELIIPPQSKL